MAEQKSESLFTLRPRGSSFPQRRPPGGELLTHAPNWTCRQRTSRRNNGPRPIIIRARTAQPCGYICGYRYLHLAALATPAADEKSLPRPISDRALCCSAAGRRVRALIVFSCASISELFFFSVVRHLAAARLALLSVSAWQPREILFNAAARYCFSFSRLLARLLLNAYLGLLLFSR